MQWPKMFGLLNTYGFNQQWLKNSWRDIRITSVVVVVVVAIVVDLFIEQGDILFTAESHPRNAIGKNTTVEKFSAEIFTVQNIHLLVVFNDLNCVVSACVWVRPLKRARDFKTATDESVRWSPEVIGFHEAWRPHPPKLTNLAQTWANSEPLVRVLWLSVSSHRR